MSNPYIGYNQGQIGKGLIAFKGLRHQRGYGFLTSLVSKAIVPLFKTIKTVNPGTIIKAAADILKGPGLTPRKPLADDIARIGGTATGALINQLQAGKGIGYKLRRKCSLKKRRSKRLVRKRKAIKVKRKSLKQKSRSKSRCCKRLRNKLPKTSNQRLKRKRSRKNIDALGS